MKEGNPMSERAKGETGRGRKATPRQCSEARPTSNTKDERDAVSNG